MDPALIRQLMIGAIPPMLLGAVIFAVLWWSQRTDFGEHRGEPRERHKVLRDFVVLSGLGASFLGLYPLIYGSIQTFPGRTADGALFYCAIIALAIGALCLFVRCITSRSIIVAVAAIAISCLTFRRGIFGADGGDAWNLGHSLFVIASLAAMSVLVSTGLTLLAERGRIGGVLSVIACVGAISQTLVVTLAQLKHAQGAGIFASFLLPAGLMVFLRPALRIPGGAMCFCGLVLATQLAQSVQFGDKDKVVTHWIIACIASAAPWAGVLALRSLKRCGIAKELLPIIACSLVGGASVGYGVYQTLAEKNNQSSGEEYDPYGP